MNLGRRHADDSDWVAEATAFITRLVDQVHDRAVVPLTTIVRAVVFGMVAGIVGVGALVLFCVAAVRLLDVYLDNVPGFPEGVWVAHLVTGAIFLIASLFLWSMRTPRPRNSNS